MAITPKARGNVINYYNSTGPKTYSKPEGIWVGLAISNDNLVNNLTFTVNGLTITVKTNETFDDDFEGFTSITVHSGSFRLVLRG